MQNRSELLYILRPTAVLLEILFDCTSRCSSLCIELNCTTSVDNECNVGDLSWADDPQLLGAGAGGSVVTSGHVSRGRGVTPGVVTQCEETCVRT